MDVRILGPLEVLEGDRDVTPRRAKARAVLAFLALHANERVAPGRIIEALWGDEPPATADKALQGHVSALRKALGADRILTEGRDYRFVLRPGELDAERFSDAIAAARRTVDPAGRSKRLAAALASWRGAPLADLAGERFAGPEAARLAALHVAALEARADAELELGHHAHVLPELEGLIGRHPLSERLRALLMLALYREGRQADALRVYHEGRRRLADELGLDPGPELAQLERRILDQDPALLWTPAARPRSRQERKTVTVLVAEAVPGPETDPEDLSRAAGPAVERIRAAVERVGGTAEPLFANALLGIFGAPRAHEDDPQRAVRAALDLVPGGTAPAGADNEPRIRGGIETGEALVTVAGEHVEITGEVLAAAARLQAGARAGSILVGPSTRRLTDATIAYRASGRGAWTPLRVRDDAARAATRDAPFVGRARELALLERAYARAREGSVQLVTITAEPGGGKSRLVRELRRALESTAAPPAWRQGRCLPYGDGVTYWALGEIVKAQAGILDSDDSGTSAGKLVTAVAALEPDPARRAWLERGLAALAGLEGAAASRSHEQSFGVWQAFFEATARQGPLVMVFEDIHWADPALLEFIEHLASHAGGVPLLLVCTARLELLETRPAWSRGSRHATAVALSPLSTRDTDRLLRSLLEREPPPETVRRASGNPLFAHELARMLGHAGLQSSIDVPETLQAVIAARLDTLPPDVKAVAADAAVVGEVFWSGAVAAMGGLDEREAEARLRRLVSNDVARPRRSSSVARQGEYGFLHALVRDVAYGQIPRRDRIAKHRAAGEWIEGLAGDRLTSHAELIAHHYVRALEAARALGQDDDVEELRPRARTFLGLAGDGARALDATQAQLFYRRALDLTDADDPSHGRVLARLGEVADLAGKLAEAEQLSRQAIAELQALGDRLGAGEAMVNLVATLWRLGRPEAERRRVAVEAVRTLEQLPPSPALVQAYSRMATHELHAGRAGACGEWSRKALEVARRLGVPTLEVQPLHHLGIARFESGDEAGIEDLRAAMLLGLEAGLGQETATAHSNLAAVTWVTEGPLAALELKRGAAEFATSRGLVSYEKTIRAEALWQQFDGGAWDDAVASADRLLSDDPGAGSSRVRTMAQTVKTRILAERGRMDDAPALEREFLPRARELRDPQDLGPALAAAAALEVARGEMQAAAALIAELERVTRGRDPSQRVHELPQAARICLAAGTIAVAEALVPRRGAPTYRRARLCLAAGRAVIAEAHGDLAAALELHTEAAGGWAGFGCPLEEAHSLLGRSRALLALGRSGDGAASAREARRIGRRLRARQVTAEADALLAGSPGLAPGIRPRVRPRAAARAGTRSAGGPESAARRRGECG